MEAGYLLIGEDGCFINSLDKSKIQAIYEPAIIDLINIYKEVFKTDLLSIYIRGSVAAGTATPYLSDIDTIAIGNKQADDSYKQSLEEKCQPLFNKHSFISKFDSLYITYHDLLTRTSKERFQFIIKYLSVCVYGEDVSSQMRLFAPDKDIVFNLPELRRRIQAVKNDFNAELDSVKIKQTCVLIMKLLIRAGFELCIEREKRFTRDLDQSFITFSEYYPDKKKEMKKVLELALYPTDDKKVILRMLNKTGMWLVTTYDYHRQFGP